MLKFSIFKKIIISFLMIGIIPLFVFGIFIANKTYETAKEDALERNSLLLNHLSYQIDLHFYTAERGLSNLVDQIVARKFSPQGFEEAFNLFDLNLTTIFQKKLFEFHFILNKDGVVETTFPLREEYVGLNYSEKDSFKQVTEKKKTYFSPRTEISLHSGELILVVALPIFNDQEDIAYVLLTELNAKNLVELTGMAQFGKSGHSLVLNPNGEIVVGPDYEMVLKHQSIDVLFPGLFSEIKNKNIGELIFKPEGKPAILVTHATLQFNDWKVLFHQPLSEVIYLFSIIRNYLVLIFFLIIIVVGGFSFVFSRGITLPLKKLSDGARAIGQGDLNVKIKLSTGDEIEELANTFNKTMEEVKKSKEGLEEAKTVLEIKVNARTKELSELVDSLELRIQERTKDLQKKVAELEKFINLIVGRELKMKELKKEIKELKDDLDKNKK